MTPKGLLRAIAGGLGYDIRSRTGPHRSSTTDTHLAWLAQQDVEVRTVLDVGASTGVWSANCQRVYPDATYVLYEPNEAHTAGLLRFVARSRAETFIERVAVGARSGEAAFDASDDFGGALVDAAVAATGRSDGRVVTVPLTTLDDSVSRLGAAGPYLVKLDTHGFERSILEGAPRVLDETSVLFVEAYNHRLTSEGLYFWELCALLHERGFRPVDLVDVMHRELDGSLWQMDLVFLRDDWPGFASSTYR